MSSDALHSRVYTMSPSEIIFMVVRCEVIYQSLRLAWGDASPNRRYVANSMMMSKWLNRRDRL